MTMAPYESEPEDTRPVFAGLRDVAEKIRARDVTFVIEHRAPEPQVAEDDPYKDFQVPDDLMW